MSYERFTGKRICQGLRYAKSSPGKGLSMKKHGHNKVQGFFYDEYARVDEDKRSIAGFCVFVGGNLVTWRSKN